MNKIVLLSLSLLLIANFRLIHAQKVEKLKKSGKEYIVNQAIEYLNEQEVDTSEIKKKKARVMADNDFVFVYFHMGFKYEAKEKLYRNYIIYIGFSDNGTQVNYDDYDPTIRKYKLTPDDEAKIKLALNTDDYSRMIESGSSYEIKEEPGYFEVTYQSDDAAWCYQIDKKTKKLKELWHEHLAPPPFEDLKEIKE
jgi:hypothetical protein